MHEINVTPFVDVMLVLLIIFMVTAPMLTSGVPIELPETKGQQLQTNKEPVTISVDKSGKLFIGDTEIELDKSPKLKTIAKNGTDEQIFIRGDKGIDYGTVMRVMGRVKAAGFTKSRSSPRRKGRRAKGAAVRGGLTTSVILHAAILAWALFTIQAQRELRMPDPEPIAVDLVNASELTRLRQGARNAKQMEAQPKEAPKAEPAKKEAPKPTPVAVAPPPPPPPEPPSRPQGRAEEEPKKEVASIRRPLLRRLPCPPCLRPTSRRSSMNSSRVQQVRELPDPGHSHRRARPDQRLHRAADLLPVDSAARPPTG